MLNGYSFQKFLLFIKTYSWISQSPYKGGILAKPKYTWLKDYTPPIYRQKSVSLEFFLDYERTILKSQIVFEPSYGKPVDLVLQGENIQLNYVKIGDRKENTQNMSLEPRYNINRFSCFHTILRL